jgi:GT2 family glycosyltransferase
MPGRNEGGRVDATLSSILSGSRPPDEIVVADGDSTDDTVARVLRHQDRGVPVRVVRNESLYAGGGRNRATAAAAHDLIVNMDFGNLATATWLEALVRPFEEDPDLDLLGGLHHPIVDTRFERVSGAVVYLEDCLVPSMDRATIEALIPRDFVPGGMCMAYRRRAWERAGGFAEWARKGQDVLFGRRVRRVGGKVGYTLEAVVRHHMAASFRELWSRHYHYDLWSARTGLRRSRVKRLLGLYVAGLALCVAAITLSRWLFLPLLLGVAVYVYSAAWRKLDVVARVRKTTVDWMDRALAPAVLFVRDAAILLGGLRGALERLFIPGWRRRTEAYLEHGHDRS